MLDILFVFFCFFFFSFFLLSLTTQYITATFNTLSMQELKKSENIETRKLEVICTSRGYAWLVGHTMPTDRAIKRGISIDIPTAAHIYLHPVILRHRLGKMILINEKKEELEYKQIQQYNKMGNISPVAMFGDVLPVARRQDVNLFGKTFHIATGSATKKKKRRSTGDTRGFSPLNEEEEEKVGYAAAVVIQQQELADNGTMEKKNESMNEEEKKEVQMVHIEVNDDTSCNKPYSSKQSSNQSSSSTSRINKEKKINKVVSVLSMETNMKTTHQDPHRRSSSITPSMAAVLGQEMDEAPETDGLFKSRWLLWVTSQVLVSGDVFLNDCFYQQGLRFSFALRVDMVSSLTWMYILFFSTVFFFLHKHRLCVLLLEFFCLLLAIKIFGRNVVVTSDDQSWLQ